MAPRFLIHSALLPMDALQLGRLVTDVRSPHNRFFDLPVDATDISTQRLDGFKDKFLTSGGLRLRAFLTSLLSVQFGGLKESTIDIKSASRITHQLRNCETWFENQLSASNEAKTWLDQTLLGGRSVYLVVGLQILVDAHIDETEGRLKETGLGFQLQASATGLSQPGANTEVGIGISNSNNPRQIRKYFASGEHIFAIEYRKIQFSWFFSRDIEADSLKKNRWKTCWGATRTLEEEEEDEEDVLEAVAADPLGKDDFEKGCDSFQVDDEEYLFLS